MNPFSVESIAHTHTHRCAMTKHGMKAHCFVYKRIKVEKCRTIYYLSSSCFFALRPFFKFCQSFFNMYCQRSAAAADNKYCWIVKLTVESTCGTCRKHHNSYTVDVQSKTRKKITSTSIAATTTTTLSGCVRWRPSQLPIVTCCVCAHDTRKWPFANGTIAALHFDCISL